MLSLLYVFFRDFLHLTEVILRLMFYLTPILYRPELFGEKAQIFFQMNPAYYPIITARSVLYDQVMPALTAPPEQCEEIVPALLVLS